MNHSLFERAKAFLNARHKKKIWYRIMYSMAVVVIFVTTYMLILPAITMERTPICGLEEHTHTEECYTRAETVRILNCQVTSPNPIIHTHDANCYDEAGNLVCRLPEVQAHTHTDACCTTGRNLVCGMTETEGSFDDGAGAFSDGNGLFDDGETHIHTDACYQEGIVLTCTLPEVIPHIHGDGCYDSEGSLACTLPEITEHQHTEECFAETESVFEPELICGKEEHIHTDDCYPAEEPTPTPEPIVVPAEEITETPTPELTLTPDLTPATEASTADPEPVQTLDAASEAAPAAETSPAGGEETNESLTPTPEITPIEDEETNESLTPTPEVTPIQDDEDAEPAVMSLDDDDLADFLTNVLILDSNGNAVGSGGLYENESYTLTLAFAENVSRQFGDSMTYQLPAGIKIPKEVSGTLSKDGEVVADYTVTTDGKLTVTFKKIATDTDGNSIGWQDSVANASFTIELDVHVDTSSLGEEGSDSVKFSDTFTFTVSTPTTELNVAKTGSFTPGEKDENDKVTTGTTSYTVTVAAKNGDVSGLVITDALTGADEGTYALKADSIIVRDSSGTLVSSENYKISANEDGQGFTITFNEGYTLEAGKSLTINYNVDVTGLDADSDVGFNQTNTVKAEGQTADKTPVESEKEARTWVSVSNAVEKNIKKYGEAIVTPDNATVDETNGKIAWTVEITDGNGLAGATVKDTLGEGLRWDEISILVVAFSEDGSKYTLSVDRDDVAEEFDASQHEELVFTLPAVDKDGKTITYNTATIYYYTNYTLNDVPVNGSKEYGNTFEVTNDGNNETGPGGSGTVSVPGKTTQPTETTKNVNVDGNTLKYTVVVKVPGLEGGYSPFYVEDSMKVTPSTGFSGSNDLSLKLTEACISNLAVKVTYDETGNEVVCDERHIVENDKLYIYFNGNSKEESNWTIAEDASITITYNVDLSELKAANTNINGESLENYLDDSGTLKNIAINHFSERTSSGSSEYSEGAELTKEGKINSDGTITYTVQVDGLNKATRAAIGNAENAYFVDILPEGWTLVEGSLTAEPLYAGASYAYDPMSFHGTIDGTASVLRADLNCFYWYDYAKLKDAYIGNKIDGQDALNAVKFTYTLAPTGDWLSNLEGYNQIPVVNKAYLEWDSAKTSEVTSTVNYGNNPLKKSVEQVEEASNLFRFTIKVNELGEQLLNGDGVLTLTDMMSSKLNLDITTLTVKDGGTNELITGYTPNYTTDADYNTLTLSGLPDNTYLLITYDTYVNEEGENVSFTNTVELTGKSKWQSSVSEEHVTITSSGTAGGTKGKFYIQKIDSNTGSALSGAKFDLYLVGNAELDERLTFDDVELESDKSGNLGYSYWYNLGNKRIWEINGSPGWFQVGNSTNENGETQYALKEITEAGYRFVLVETEAPDGYELLAEPIVIAYGSDNVEGCISVDYAGTVIVENTPLTTVTVKKEWKDSNGQNANAVSTSVNVALMQVAHYDYEEEVTPAETYTLRVSDINGETVYTIGKDAEVTLADSGVYSGDITLIGESDTPNRTVTTNWSNSVNKQVATFALDGNYSYTTANKDWQNNLIGTVTVNYEKATETRTATNEIPYTYKNTDGTEVSYTATLNSANNWSTEWSNLKLPAAGTVTVDGETYDCTYTYYVKETSKGDWTTTYTVGGQTAATCPDISGDAAVTITNTVGNEEKTSIKVEKKWLSDAGNLLKDGDHPTSITVQLYQTLTVGEKGSPYSPPVTLGNAQAEITGYDEDGWSYTWENLPAGLYYVVETLEDGQSYTVSYTNNGTSEVSSTDSAAAAAITEGTITITNTKQPAMSVKVKKQWLDVNGDQKTGYPGEITVELYKKGDSETSDTLQGTEIKLGSAHSSESGYSDSGWSYTWENLPLGTYYVKEKEILEGYNAAYQLETSTSGEAKDNASEVTVEEADGTIILYNKETPVEISVMKQWSDGKEAHTSDTVTMQLYSSTTAPQAQPSTILEPTEAPSPSAAPEPSATPEPSAIPSPSATPEPSAIPSPSATPEPSAAPSPSVTPEPGEMRAVTVFCPSNGSNYGFNIAENKNVETTIDKVIVKITYNSWDMHDDNYQAICEKVSLEYPDGIICEGPEYGKDSVDNYNYLLYTISGLSNVSGDCILTFNENFTWPRTSGNTITPLEDGNSVALYSLDLADLELSAQADVSTVVETAYNDGLTGLDLPEDAVPVRDAILLGTTCASNTSYDTTGWKYTWSNLPRTNDEGQKLYYYVKEMSTDAYTASYEYEYLDSTDPSKGIKAVTVTNTPTNPTTVDITVKKEWSGYSTTSYADYEVTVQLLRDGEAYGDSVTLSALSDTPWSYTWSNLPSGHNYSVEEISVKNSKSDSNVTGYEVSYSNTAGIQEGEITITNTRETTYELPETGGPGTKMYTLGGLLLSVLAALFMYKQQKQRREVN